MQAMEKLSAAHIEMANIDVNHLKSKPGPYNLPDSALKKLSQAGMDVALPTMEIRVSMKLHQLCA